MMDGVLVGKDAPAVGNVVSAMNLIFCGSYARVQARTGLVAPRAPRQSDGSGLQFWLGRPHFAGTSVFCQLVVVHLLHLNGLAVR